MICNKCGKELADSMKFCDECGTSTSEKNTTSKPVQPQASTTPVATNTTDNKVIFMLAYLGILFFLPLLVAPDSQKAKFHANQGLLLLLTSIIGNIIISIFSKIVGFVGMWFLGSLLSFVFGVAMIALLIIGMSGAYNGKEVPLPVIGTLFTIIK